jgi:hypothetical protein
MCIAGALLHALNPTEEPMANPENTNKEEER